MVSRLSVTVDYDDFKDRQLVIEAVPEDWDLKVYLPSGDRGAAGGRRLPGVQHFLAVRQRAGP